MCLKTHTSIKIDDNNSDDDDTEEKNATHQNIQTYETNVYMLHFCFEVSAIVSKRISHPADNNCESCNALISPSDARIVREIIWSESRQTEHSALRIDSEVGFQIVRRRNRSALF